MLLAAVLITGGLTIGSVVIWVYFHLRREAVHYPRIHKTIRDAIATYQEHDKASSAMMRDMLMKTASDEATFILWHLRNEGLARFVLPAPDEEMCPHEREWDECPECCH